MRARSFAVVLVFSSPRERVDLIGAYGHAQHEMRFGRRSAGACTSRALLLTESVLVAFVGSAAGVALASSVSVAPGRSRQRCPAVRWHAHGFPRLGEVVIDLPVLSFTVASRCDGHRCVAWPRLCATRGGEADVLRQGVGSTASPGEALVCQREGHARRCASRPGHDTLVGAGLLAQSFLTLTRADVGYDRKVGPSSPVLQK